MFSLKSQPQCQTGDNQKSRSLVRNMTEVAPLLDISPFSSSSSSTTTRSIFSDGHDEPASPNRLPIVQYKLGWTPTKTFSLLASILRSLFPSLQSLLTPVCHWLNVSPVMNPTSASPCRRRITGTFFGHKRGRVCFAVQEDPRSEPALLLDLAIPTCHLVKEMASGVLRILLECERSAAPAATGAKKMKKHPPHRSLWEEPRARWTMYCNGHKRGYAVSRPCTDSDFQVLSAVQAVSVGAGVLPVASFPPALPPHHCLEKKDGGGGAGSEVMYMRAKFERVLGGKDSEAFYMINPDCGRGSNGGPELSIFLLRV